MFLLSRFFWLPGEYLPLLLLLLLLLFLFLLVFLGAEDHFYGFSAFSYTWDFLNVSASADLSTVQTAAEAICAMDMTELTEFNAKRAEPEASSMLSGYCFTACYALGLLRTYGFPDSGTPLTVVADVNGTEATWAYGSILYHANKLEWMVVVEGGDAPPPDGPSDGSDDPCVGGGDGGGSQGISTAAFYGALGALIACNVATAAAFCSARVALQKARQGGAMASHDGLKDRFLTDPPPYTP